MFLIGFNHICVKLLIIVQFICVILATNSTDNRVVSMKNPKFELDFHLPFTDIKFSSSKYVNVFETKNVVFMLHGSNLYFLHVNKSEKEFKFIQKFEGNIEQLEVLDVEAIIYNDHLVLLFIFDDFIEVYQLDNKWKTPSTASLKIPLNARSLHSVQQITIHGTFRKAELFHNHNNRLFLVMAVKFSKLHGRLSIYEWTHSSFHQSLESNHQSINSFKVLNGTDNEPQNPYIVTIKYHQSKAFIDVFKWKTSTTMELKSIQNLVIPSTHSYPFAFKGRNNLLLCQRPLTGATKSSSTHKSCRLFTMIDGHFIEYHYFQNREQFFSSFAVGADNFFVGENENEILIYPDIRTDCFSAFKTNNTNLTTIAIHKSEANTNFLLLCYITPFRVLIRVVEVEFKSLIERENHEDAPDDFLSSTSNFKHHIFEDTISKLKSALLKRKLALEPIKQKLKDLHAKDPNIVVSDIPLELNNEEPIPYVKVVRKNLKHPSELKKAIQKLKSMVQELKEAIDSRAVKSRVERQTKENNLQVNRLSVENLIYDGDLFNGIRMSTNGETLTVNLPVTADSLQTESLIIPDENEFKVKNMSENLTVKSLYVNEINGVSWDRFNREVFLQGRDKTVNGNLTFRQPVTIESANAIHVINNISVKDGFNLVHPQNVSSTLFIPEFFLTILETDSLNGLNFVNDVAKRGKDNFIDSYVTIENMAIEGNLTLVDESPNARHMFGTSFEDFQQIYSGRVVINGSLTVNNIDLKSADVYLNDKLIDLNFSRNYWLKSIDQTFTHPVVFKNSIIECPELAVKSLNEHPVNQYLLTDTITINDPISLLFNSTSVDGSVFTDKKYPTKLEQLSTNAIRYGEQANIFGHKTFTTIVEVDHLITNTINEISTADLVHKRMENVNFTGGLKSFEYLKITNSANIRKNLKINILNNRTYVGELFKYNYRLDTLNLKNKIHVQDIVFENLNGHNIKQIFKDVELTDKELVIRKNVFIDGDVIFEQNLQVDYINGQLWNDYRNKLALLNDNHLKLGGKKRFNSLHVLENLKVDKINGVNVLKLFENILLSSRPQIITGKWTFNNVKFNELSVETIDNIDCSELIDVHEDNVVINSSIAVNTLRTGGDLFGNFRYNFEKIENQIRVIEGGHFEDIWVLQNAEWPTKYGNETLLDYFYHNAVRINADQTITGKVELAQSPLVTSMTEHNSIFPIISQIAKDCLYRHSSTEQIVTGLKSFNSQLHIGSMIVERLLNYPIINKIDILAFNTSLYRINKETSISGKVRFLLPPIIENLFVEGNINDVDIDQMYFSGVDYKKTPNMIISNMVTNNLKINEINQINLDLWHKTRVRKHGEAQEIFGFLTFDNLVLSKDIQLQSINGIRIDSLLMKSSNHLQEVHGKKTVKELTLVGPAVVVNLNNVDVIEKYRRTVFLNQNYNFSGIKFESGVLKNGLVVHNLLNGYPFDEFLNGYNILHHKLRSNLDKFNMCTKTIENIVIRSPKSKRLLYLEHDINSIIRWNKSMSVGIESEIVTRIDECNYQKLIVKYASYIGRISISRHITNTISRSLIGCNATLTHMCSNVEHYSELNVGAIKLVFDGIIHNFHTFHNSLNSNFQYSLVQINDRITLFRFEIGKSYFLNKLTIYGDFRTIKLFTIESIKYLLTNFQIENRSVLLIYQFDDYNEIFTEIQSIDGEFNIIEMFAIKSDCYHLLLSCENCGKLLIYEYNRLTNTLVIYQRIDIKARVYELIHLDYNDEKYFILVTKFDSDLYHLYKYNYVQGWQHFTFGYFNGIEYIHPLVNANGLTDRLLLLGKVRNSAINLYSQGEGG